MANEQQHRLINDIQVLLYEVADELCQCDTDRDCAAHKMLQDIARRLTDLRNTLWEI